MPLYHNVSASNVQHDARDPLCVRRSKEERCVSHVVRRAESLKRVLVSQNALLGQWNELLIALGENDFGRYTINANSIRPCLCGEVLRQYLDSGFSGGIRDRRLRMRLTSSR